jgi:iron complex outermembrane receptor protein
MAPGIQVARLDNYRWAITSRGFDRQFSNKLLVLIDGRSVYTPSYSGIFWDVQDTLLEDINRIEVIRGPGATVWGANAVNGVVNIITKTAADTEGGLLVAGAGNEEKGFAALRYGTKLGDATYGRGYLKYNDRDSSYAPTLDQEAGDDWKGLRAGFRMDGTLDEPDHWTLLGDVYDIDAKQIIRREPQDPADPANNPPDPSSPYIDRNVPQTVDANGWHLLGRWEHRLSGYSSANLQLYYNHYYRKDSGLGLAYNTLDIDFHHQFRPWGGHDLVWGLGYRRIEDEFDNSFGIELLPDSRITELYSVFVQDEVELTRTLRLALGSKFEHNDYIGFEAQPSARLLWLPKEGHSLWTSISRAVRTPSRLENDGFLVLDIITPPRLALPHRDCGLPSCRSMEMKTSSQKNCLHWNLATACKRVRT